MTFSPLPDINVEVLLDNYGVTWVLCFNLNVEYYMEGSGGGEK